MSLEAWAAIAEIIGAIAVVITLAYLAVQIRQNSSAIRKTLRRLRSDSSLMIQYLRRYWSMLNP